MRRVIALSQTPGFPVRQAAGSVRLNFDLHSTQVAVASMQPSRLPLSVVCEKMAMEPCFRKKKHANMWKQSRAPWAAKQFQLAPQRPCWRVASNTARRSTQKGHHTCSRAGTVSWFLFVKESLICHSSILHCRKCSQERKFLKFPKLPNPFRSGALQCQSYWQFGGLAMFFTNQEVGKQA